MRHGAWTTCRADTRPWGTPVLLYNGLPAWRPRPSTKGWNEFEYTFIDVGRLPRDRGKPHPLTAALSGGTSRAGDVVAPPV